MANIKGLLTRIDTLWLWRGLLVASVIGCLAAASLLWFSGDDETDNAVQSGRRLVINLKDGKVEGKLIALADLEKPASAEAAPEPATKEADKPQEPPTEPPPVAAEPAAPDAPKPEAPAETPPVTPAENPPATAAENPEAPAAPAPAAPDAATPENPAPAEAPAEPAPAATPTAETPPTPPAGTVPPAEGPEVNLPEAAPVSPTAPTYQDMPPAPADQSQAPAVAPETAPAPPLVNQPVPAVQPSSQKLRGTNSSITEQAQEGTLPIVAPDGTKAWRYYAKPFERKGNEPIIALIITGLGQNKLVSENALALNENITLSFSPYVQNPEQWANSARLAGHEVMVDLPLDPANYPATDPGPYGLLLEKTPEENESRLRWLMSRMTTSVGFVTPRNDRFTDNPEQFKLLVQSLANRGLMLVVTRDTSKEKSKEVLGNTTTPHLVVNLVIDEDLSETTIQAKLSSLEQLAQKQGFAVGVARSYPISIAEIKKWIDQLAAKGIVLVPVSAVARLDFS